MTNADLGALRLAEKLTAPPGVKPPEVACVSCDGDRMQRCDLLEGNTYKNEIPGRIRINWHPKMCS